MISKTWVSFQIATILLWFEKIDGSIWAGAMLIAVGASTYQKVNGVQPDMPKEE